MSAHEAIAVRLGRMPYRACWELQKQVHAARARGDVPDCLLLVEHDPAITHGSAFNSSNLLLDADGYARRGIELVQTDRGGDVTYHGPNQLVIYPIFDVKAHGGDLHVWLRNLEQTVILALEKYGLEGYRFPPNTGVWVNERKIAAIGIKVSKWINLHGIALNCDNDLSPFSLIVPCGIKGYGVTSLTKEVGEPIGISDAMPHIISSFEQVFNIHLREATSQTLNERIGNLLDHGQQTTA